MSSISSIPTALASDEVDLVALFRAVWQQKKLILSAMALIGCVSVAYAFLAPPEYQVGSVLRPAAINELDALNRSEVYKISPNEALSKVGASLESYETRLGFFRANIGLFSELKRPGRTLEQSFEEFNRNSISLLQSDSKKPDNLGSYIGLELKYPKNVDGVAILNGLVDYAIAAEREQIAADLKVIVNNRLNEIKGKIDAARSNYETEKQAKIAMLLEADKLKRAQLQDELKGLRLQLKAERSDRIAQLNEAISIAKSLGITKPTTPASMSDAQHNAPQSVMRIEINNQQIPLYFMGVEALEAERSALQQRKSDDFTEKRIAEIAKQLELLKFNREIEVLNDRKSEDIILQSVQPLRAEEARLRNLNIDMSGLKLVTIDRKALEPINPIKPKKALIIALGFVLGLILGVLTALTRHLLIARGQAEHQTRLLEADGKIL